MNTRLLALSFACVVFAGAAAHAAENADPTATYMDNCVECHGPDAKGVKGAGVDLTASAFVKKVTDAQFIEFLKVGRAASDRASKTAQLMPAFDYLSDAEMRAVIVFVDGKKAK